MKTTIENATVDANRVLFNAFPAVALEDPHARPPPRRSVKNHSRLDQLSLAKLETMSEVVRARVVIAGRVQGVFFRHETSRRARSRGLGGWVRNRPDGAVEAVFEGPAQEVESMIRWCRTGPSLAEVTSVEVQWEEAQGESDFPVR